MTTTKQETRVAQRYNRAKDAARLVLSAFDALEELRPLLHPERSRTADQWQKQLADWANMLHVWATNPD